MNKITRNQFTTSILTYYVLDYRIVGIWRDLIFTVIGCFKLAQLLDNLENTRSVFYIGRNFEYK